MARIALVVEYNGQLFHGWQYQNESLPTVEKALSYAVGKVANHHVTLTCAGRTDRGVHALSQVVHFDSTAIRPVNAWLNGVNRYLPKEIAVKYVKIVPDHFHARFSALARQYCYIIDNCPTRSAIWATQVTWHRRLLDERLMQQATTALIGEHDFSAFRSSHCQAQSPIRRLDQLEVQRLHQYIIVKVKANAFLHHMVRNMMGVLLAIGEGNASPSWAFEALVSKDRRLGGVTAAASGLYLQSVDYPVVFSLPSQGRAWPFFMVS